MYAINDLSEFNSRGLVLDSKKPYLGAGSFGCVLKGYVGGAASVFKVLVQNPDDAGAILREYYIGSKLKQSLPNGINNMFAGATGLYVSSVGLPDEWAKVLIDNNCETFKNQMQVHILVQEFVAGGITGHEWLAAQSGPLSGEIVRSIVFQLVLALGYAHSQLGFQHNDLKLENMFLIPSSGGETLTYKLGGTDVFQVQIPAGGARICIIDFGGSSFVAKDEVPEFLQPSPIFTPGYTPFELSLFAQEFIAVRKNPGTVFSPLYLRHNDADLISIFMIMMNLVANKRNAIITKPATRATGESWDYELIDGTGSDYINGITDSTIRTDANPLSKNKALKTIYDILPKDLFPRDDPTVAAATNNDIQVNILVPLLVHYALGSYPAVDLQDPYNTYINQGIEYDVLLNRLGANWDLIISQKFKDALEKLVDSDKVLGTEMFARIPFILNECFGPENGAMARLFCQKLYAITPQQRRAFGVNVAGFERFTLANALYHPFLAEPYWVPAGTVAAGLIALGESDAPLEFNSTKGSGLELDAQKKLDEYNNLISNLAPTTVDSGKKTTTKKATPAPKQDDDNDAAPDAGDTNSVPMQPMGGSVLSPYLEIAKRNYANKSLVADGNGNPAHTPTEDEIDEFFDKFIKPACTTIQNVLGNKADRLYNWFGFFGENGDIPGTTEPDDVDAAFKRQSFAAAAMVLLSAAMALERSDDAKAKQLIALMGKVSSPSADAYEMFTAQTWGKFKKSADWTKFAAETNFNPIATEIGSESISSHLEIIERNPDYTQVGGEAYHLDAISDELYEPLREAVAVVKLNTSHADGAKLVQHLGLGDAMFKDARAFAGIDMNNVVNQTRYFHTLSVLASMIESGVYDQMERCFVEWPPKAPLRPGEVHEV